MITLTITEASATDAASPEAGGARARRSSYVRALDHSHAHLPGVAELRNIGVVKNVQEIVRLGGNSPVVDPACKDTLDGRTRDRVADLLLQMGAASASELGSALGLSPAGIRRHLDAMQAEGLVESRERPSRGRRGRGRPARVFTLTEAAREALPHTYDGLASAALRWIAEQGGPQAVAAFAAAQVAALEERCRAAMLEAGDDPLARAEALAGALTAEGYAAGRR
jgi:predicted ArsR family transcriptional regulator